MTGPFYLCSPYSRHPRGLDAAHDEAVRAAVTCIRSGIAVLCPIAHGHLIAKRGDFSTDYETWRSINDAMIEASRGLIVVMLDGWRESAGVNQEIAFAKALGLPVYYMEPDKAPVVA